MYPVKNWHSWKRGYTYGEKTFYSNFHLGVDLMVPVGTPIYAPFDGFVTTAENSEIGKMVSITGRGVVVRFMHNSEFKKTGQVKAGDMIALSGNTGLSTGPHTHIDVSKGKVNIHDHANFIDPEKYFCRELKAKVLVNDKLFADLFDRLLEVKNWYLGYGVDITFEVEQINYVDIPWSGNYLNTRWLKMQAAPRASGYDICILAIPNKQWKNSGLYGYAKNDKVLGIELLAVKYIDKKDDRNRGVYNNDQFSATLRHELMHTLYDMVGLGASGNKTEYAKATDNTHYWDYISKNLSGAFDDFEIYKINGWNSQKRYFRYVLTNTKAKQLSFVPIPNKVYKTQDERMFFVFSFGEWQAISDEIYEDKVKLGARRGVISTEEGNWIRQKLGLSIPERQDDILERIATNTKDELWLKLQGFKQFIPKDHI